MKKVSFILILFLLCSGMLVMNSCTKEDEIIAPHEEMASQKILKFNSTEEFEVILDSVSNMTVDERLLWEKRNNFKSFGTSCDELFYSINFDSLKTSEELVSLDTKGMYINVYTKANETFIEPAEIGSKERFLVNEDKIVIIGSEMYKLCDSALLSIDTLDADKQADEVKTIVNRPHNRNLKSALYETKTAEEENTFSGYKLKVHIQTENYWGSFPTRTDMETEFTITNYKKGILGWYVKQVATNYTISIKSYDDISGMDDQIDASATNHDIGSYNKPSYKYLSDEWSNKFNPHFSQYNIIVSTKFCTVNMFY